MIPQPNAVTDWIDCLTVVQTTVKKIAAPGSVIDDLHGFGGQKPATLMNTSDPGQRNQIRQALRKPPLSIIAVPNEAFAAATFTAMNDIILPTLAGRVTSLLKEVAQDLNTNANVGGSPSQAFDLATPAVVTRIRAELRANLGSYFTTAKSNSLVADLTGAASINAYAATL